MVGNRNLVSGWLLLALICSAECYRILGVFHTSARSHFSVGSSLLKALAEKGHDVTMIAPYEIDPPMKNYRTVKLDTILKDIKDAEEKMILRFIDHDLLNMFKNLYEFGLNITSSTLSEPSVQQLMASNEKFDVVIAEVFLSDALFGLAEHFNAPLIGVGTFGAYQWNTDLTGSPSPPSYVPNPFLQFTDKMNLFQRIANLAVATMEHIFFNYLYLPKQQNLFRTYFPNSKVGLEAIRKNTSLVLLNSHFSMSYPRPYLPNMIEVGGMHIDRKLKPLPDDMQKFLDEAKDGVIYFSMGSNVKSKILPAEKRDALLNAFKGLKQRVMWKYEKPDLPGKTDNIFISDWFPQNDILAHPNCRFFITHGGLLSVTESIYYRKPFIGIPMFGDQFLNMARAEAGGYGITVDYKDMSTEKLRAAIDKMLSTHRYRQSVEKIAERFRDQPIEPLKLATYWVEYVARHKGAPHLRSASQELSFIAYHNIDAIIILYGGLLLSIVLLLAGVYAGIKKAVNALKGSTTTEKNKKKKKN